MPQSKTRTVLFLAGALAALGQKVEMCNVPSSFDTNLNNFNTYLVEERNVQKRLDGGDLLGSCYDNCQILCDDGSECTIDFLPSADTCTCITCSAGDPDCDRSVVCDDSEVCTADSCNPSTGCVFDFGPVDGNPCNADSDVCTDGDSCSEGTCEPGATLTCDDLTLCTQDTCNPISGCVNTPSDLVCDDDADCSTDTCEPLSTLADSEGCVYKENDSQCDDSEVCTADSCVSGSGGDGCVFEGAPKNGDPCNADSDVCTDADSCSAGTCVAGPPLTCDDPFSCTEDTCNPTTGCVFTPLDQNCNDATSCSTDTCEPLHANANGEGCVYDEDDSQCNDNNGCTADICVSFEGDDGCVFDPSPRNGESCNADSDVCTDSDSCSAGTCVPGPDLDCDDGIPCTTDSCNQGCVHTPVDTACGGISYPECGQPYCSTNSGCEVELFDEACEDGIPCTLNVCTMSGCTFEESDLACNDGVGCTDEFCVPDAQYADQQGCVYEIAGRRLAYTSEPVQQQLVANYPIYITELIGR